MVHTFLKVPHLPTMSFIGQTFLKDGDRVINYSLEEKVIWSGVQDWNYCYCLTSGARDLPHVLVVIF